MRMNTSMVRSLTKLELTFYDELLAPLLLFMLSRPDEMWAGKRMLLTQSFKKDVARFGYVLTKSGAVMIKVEPDILDIELDTIRRAMVAEDMKILGRLTAKSK